METGRMGVDGGTVLVLRRRTAGARSAQPLDVAVDSGS